MGTKRIKNIIIQVSIDDSEAFKYLRKNWKTPLKTLVTTAARTITDMNGHRSHPSISVESSKIARKYHSFILLAGSFMEGLYSVKWVNRSMKTTITSEPRKAFKTNAFRG
jgi:hypothetical protein